MTQLIETILPALSCLLVGAVSQQGTSFEEKLLGKVTNADQHSTFCPTFRPDGCEAAFTENLGTKSVVVVGDRRLGSEYSQATHPFYSARGDHLGYVADRDGRKFVVNGGAKGPEFDEICEPQFSPDGRHLAYWASREGKYLVVVDDATTGPWEWVEWIRWSPDSRRAIFAARNKGTWYVVDGDRKSEPYRENAGIDPVGRAAFSPDGTQFAYAAYSKPYEWRVIVGEKKGEAYDGIEWLAYTPDGRLAYIAQKGDLHYFIVVGEETRKAPYAWVSELAFCANGRRMGLVAKDRRPEMGSDRFGMPHANGGGGSFVVLGEEKGALFSDIRGLVLSPDGSRAAYLAREGGHWFVVAGKKRSEPYDLFDIRTRPIFSPDSRRVAFGVVKGGDIWWKVLSTE